MGRFGGGDGSIPGNTLKYIGDIGWGRILRGLFFQLKLVQLIVLRTKHDESLQKNAEVDRRYLLHFIFRMHNDWSAIFYHGEIESSGGSRSTLGRYSTRL